MADYVMAANGLADLVAQIVAPGGVSSVANGARVKIYVGWPDKQTLDADLSAGNVHVSVWPLPIEKQTSVTQTDMGWEQTGPAQATRKLQRRTRHIQIGIWANTPHTRDAIGAQLEPELADLSRFTLSDGSQAILSYGGGKLVDDRQTANLYRRDIAVGLNYALTKTMTATPIEKIAADLTIEVTPGAEIATYPIIITAED